MGEEKTYRIGEVAALLNLNASALRYWEDEFPQLRSLRTCKGQRRYTESHISMLRFVQGLLYDKGMTIEGARRVLEDSLRTDGAARPTDPALLRSLEEDLLSLRDLLSFPLSR